MMRPLLPVLFFMAALATLLPRSVQRGDTSGPMGIGTPDDPNGHRQWMLERLRDPATGELPADMRRKELAHARTMPHRATAKSLTWSFLGPRDRGGRTRAMEVDITNEQVLLAGGVTGGLWRSTDAGATWTRTSPRDAMTGVTSLVQDRRPGRESTWYFGTGENYGVVSGTSFSALLPGDGIFKSTDGGQSWWHLPSTIAGDHQNYTRNGSFKQVNRLVIDPTRNDSDVVLAAVFNGIFRSNDGGDTWHAVLGLDPNITGLSVYTDLQVSPTGVFYAAAGNNGPIEGFWRSTNGQDWTLITPPGFPTNAERTVIAIDPGDVNVVWWFTETPGSGTSGHSLWRYEYLSGDGSGAGGLWNNRSANLPNTSCTGYFNFDFGPINSQGGYDMCLAVHPADPNVIFLGGTNIYRSNDGFTSTTSTRWVGGYYCNTADPKDYVYPGHHPDQHAFTFLPSDPNVLYSSSDGGISVTYDCMADSIVWVPINDSYITSQFYTVHQEKGGTTATDFILGGTQDNGCWLATTDDAAVNWSYVHIDDGAYCAIPRGRDFMLVSSQLGRIYKKPITDQGEMLGFERIDPSGVTTSYNFINAFVIDPLTNNQLYVAAANRIWRNSDLASIAVTDNWYNKIATNWAVIPEATLPGTQRITCLAFSESAPHTLFYGTTVSRVWRLDTLDGTPVRTAISSNDWPQNAYVSCVAPNDFDPDELLVTFSNYNIPSVWRSADGGQSWSDVSGNLEQNPDGTGNGPAVFWATIYPSWNNTANRYFVATSTGIYSTDMLDGTNTVWEQEAATTIGNVPVNMLDARTSDGRLVAATHGVGVHGAWLPAAPIGVQEHGAPALIAAPWPNPARDEARFPLYLPRSGAVHITVHALDGTLLHRADLGTLPAGNHTWRWDLRTAGDAVPTGTYLVRATAQDRSSTQRLVVLR